MPEGHTIHRIGRDHGREFVGQKLRITSPQGRFIDGAGLISGKQLKSVTAHGKHLCYRFAGEKLLHIHLGLYGKFRQHQVPPPEPRGAVRLRAVGERRAFDLNGPTRCELITKTEWAQLQNRLGPDPLRQDADPDRVWERMKNSRQAIGKLLMDQSVIAGVGNVYRSEVLFLLRIHPERAGNQLDREEFDALWDTLVELLHIGVRYNRIIVADPEDIGKTRGKMTRDERLLIYKRDTCIRCDGTVRWWELGSRTAYACERCQA